MATVGVWNKPGDSWDKPGLVWGPAKAAPKSMSNVKAKIDFSDYTAAALGPLAQTIHDSMTAAATTFPSPPVVMTALATLIATFNTKLAARASRATADVIAFNLARHELEVALHDLGIYVNTVAKGDLAIVQSSGFPYYGVATPGASGPPAAPTNVVLRLGHLSGSIVARYHPDRPGSFNEVHTCTGDPNVEANWHYAGSFGGGKATLSSLAPGTILWLRIRTIGAGSVPGAWSDPARIVVG